ncbi:MAG: hypothetical protein ABWJ99_05775 [Caldimicrobium sp.]
MDSIHSKALLKFLLYLTAHHPEEFGLIPNRNNFFKVKEIFQVLIFTKKNHNLKINSLKQLFTYYFRDFFEFLEEFNLVRPKEYFFSPPKEVHFSEILKYNQLFTFVKPRFWYKIALDGEVFLRESHPLFVERELAENWAKVKGGLLIEVNPKFLPKDWKYEIFGETIVLTQGLNYKACRGPKIDEKFINKFLKEKSQREKEDPHIISFKALKIESEEKEEDLPFRKITHGKKKEKPWKTWQKKKQREREK